ncbi:hypothetical protein [Paenibacillus agricola]|uniref:Uncharacterized protein n=1 Tax=Paenibacillus agricola TaxID=2716264 RepID=A0ABX0JHR8_9BACL|nr:hypothetical protein [Paenibacillus agricola]NHN34864.1 hypothetical protein [Paenibacillus agricola]
MLKDIFDTVLTLFDRNKVSNESERAFYQQVHQLLKDYKTQYDELLLDEYPLFDDCHSLLKDGLLIVVNNFPTLVYSEGFIKQNKDIRQSIDTIIEDSKKHLEYLHNDDYYPDVEIVLDDVKVIISLYNKANSKLFSKKVSKV